MSNLIDFMKKNNEKVLEYRICQWTGEKFPIFEKDVEMIKKLSPTFLWKKFEIPLPTLSPRARQIRRLLSRNEWNFYKSRSNKTGESMISLYAPENKAKIFEQKEWWQEDWSPMDYGFDFDFSKSMTEQFYNMRNEIPRVNLVTVGNENSDYTTGTWYCKDCYLINSSENSEDCYYWKLFQDCKNCVDCTFVYDSEKLYQCLNVKKSYNCTYLHNSAECNNCYYSDDLVGCNFCIMSSNLRNSQYYFENKKCEKEEWEKLASAYLWKRTNIKNATKKFEEVIQNKKKKYASITSSVNCFWDVITESKNCFFSYDVNKSEDCRYVNIWVEVKDNMDCNNMYLKPEKSYEVLWTIGTYNVHFSTYVFNSSNVFYSQDCHDCKNLFGCIALRWKEYCIFNKQYSKEEWEKEVIKVVEYMQKTGEWGEYFDVKMSAFPYNDSLACEYFPVKEVINLKNWVIESRKIFNENGKGIVYVLEWEKEISKAKLDLGWEIKVDIFWKTKNKEIGIPENTLFLETKDLKETISGENDDIIKKVIKCSVTGRPFRIIAQEFNFYKNMNLPIPDVHPNERYFNRLSMKPQRNLSIHNCTKCNKEVVSVYREYSPVYCEECYNKEIY